VKKNCIHAQPSMAIFFVLRAQFFFILGSVKSENELERIRKRTFLCWRRNLFACCRVSCSAVCFRFCVKWERRSETCGCSVRSTCWQPPQLISSCITFTRHDKKREKNLFSIHDFALHYVFASDRARSTAQEEEKWFWEVYCLGWGDSEADKVEFDDLISLVVSAFQI
jgi:hypothetical protein